VRHHDHILIDGTSSTQHRIISHIIVMASVHFRSERKRERGP
jgi:hypothetical protein